MRAVENGVDTVYADKVPQQPGACLAAPTVVQRPVWRRAGNWVSGTDGVWACSSRSCRTAPRLRFIVDRWY